MQRFDILLFIHLWWHVVILDRDDNTRRGSRDGRNGADAFLVADGYRFSLRWNKFASEEVELSRGADDPVRTVRQDLLQ